MSETTTVERCSCGRAVKRLNPTSDEAKCVGCGYVPALCRCREVSR